MTTIITISPTPFDRRIDTAFGTPGFAERRWEDAYLYVKPAKIVADCDGEDVRVVCIGPGIPDEIALAIAEAFDQVRPECGILLVTDPTAKVWQEALRAGVREVVPPTASDDALCRALEAVLGIAERRRASLSSGDRPAKKPHRVITVLSPKGGSGKTTVSTNLAVGLARSQPGKVALVDLDLQFGDVASALQLTPEHSIADVGRAPRDFDQTMLKVLLTGHPSGAFVLAAPSSPAEADELTAHHSGRVVDMLREDFPYVVIDTGAGIDEHCLAAIERSTDLVLLGSMDVAAVRALRKEIEVLDQITLQQPTRHLILNRSDSKVGMAAADIEAVLGQPIDISIPSSRLAPLSSNEGSPLLESSPRSPIARSLLELVGRFTDEAPASHEGGGRLRRKVTR